MLDIVIVAGQFVSVMGRPGEFVKTERDLLLVSSHLSDHPEFNGLGRSAKGLKLVSLMTR